MLEERRPRGEQVLARERPGPGLTQQHGQPGSQPVPFTRVADVIGEPGIQALGDDRAGVGLDQPEPRAHRLGQRPERDPVPVGQAPAPMPPRRRRQAVDVLLELPRQPGLPDPGLTIENHQPRPTGLLRGVEQLLDQAQVRVPAGERGLQPIDPLGAADPATTMPACHSRIGSALPLSSCSPTSVNVIAADARPRVASSTHTCPGAAADCTRAAVFTASPATIPSAVAPTVTATSPVTIPTRCANPGAPTSSPRAVTIATSSKARTHGALGVVLVRDRHAPHRHHRVTDELLDHPAIATDDHPALLEVRREQLPHLLGVLGLRQRREPHQIPEQHRRHPTLSHRPIRPGRGWRDPERDLERSAALGTELASLRRCPASRANPGRHKGPTLGAELHTLDQVRSAGSTRSHAHPFPR